jgi:hypothetical protein
MIKWVKFEHTIIFFVVANLLVWGSWHLFLKPEKRHQAKITAIQKQIQQEQQLSIPYSSVPYKAQEKAQQEQQLPIQHDINKSVPYKMQEKAVREKSVRKYDSGVMADEAPSTKIYELPNPRLETPVKESWFDNNWPILTSILTAVPTIVIKWKEMYDKIFKRKKRKHKR